MNWFAKLRKFFQPKLGNVLASFDKTLNKLEKIAVNEAREVEASLSAIARHNATIASAEATIAKATTVKANLNTLLGN